LNFAPIFLRSAREGRSRATPATLEVLHRATQAWAEQEYNLHVHSETTQTPLERWLAGPPVGRPCPSSDTLRRVYLRKRAHAQVPARGEPSAPLTVLAARHARGDPTPPLAKMYFQCCSVLQTRPSASANAFGPRPLARHRHRIARHSSLVRIVVPPFPSSPRQEAIVRGGYHRTDRPILEKSEAPV
jgi:hypothetical protein